MGWVDVVLIVYAALNIVGGVIGYMKAHSMPSIIAGVVIGALVIVSVVTARGNARVGYGLAAVVTAATLAFFAYRLATRGGTVPTMMVVASLAVLACLGAGHFMNRS